MKKKNQIAKRDDYRGLLFLIPLIFGLIFFFIVPMIESVRFSLSNVSVGTDGYILRFSGFDSFYEALFKNTEFPRTLANSVLDMLFNTPLIIIFSFFMASVLNQKFKGRTIFRVIFFLPVIISSAAVSAADNGDALQNSMANSDVYKNTFDTATALFSNQISQWLLNAGVSTKITDAIISSVDGIYDVINLSGIQILIFLTGMQSIPSSLYEASYVEGATGWENFWKITFPMVTPLILTGAVYTVIDTFTGQNNGMMKTIHEAAFTNQNFSLSSAMSLIYFFVVAVFLIIISKLISKRVFYYYE